MISIEMYLHLNC